MNSVRKVKRRQYDNLAVIAFFPPTVFGRAESHIPRHVAGNVVLWSVTAVNGGHILTLYPRPVNSQRGQVVVMPNPVDSWLMGGLSLVLGWSIICLIKQDRHQIIELLTALPQSRSSSDRRRAQSWSHIRFVCESHILMREEIKSCPFILSPAVFDVLTSDWGTFWLHFLTGRSLLCHYKPKKKGNILKDHISNHQAVFFSILVSLLDTCQQPSEKCWHGCPPVRQPAPSVWTWI